MLRTISSLLLVAPLAAAAAEPTLKDAFADDFRVGVAISTATTMRPEWDALTLAAKHFNSATPENLLKWERVHPEPKRFDFGPADRFVAFGEQHGMFLVGHTLVWHSQTPEWVFRSPDGRRDATRDELLQRMREHILVVVGRYRGRIQAWDVVNEALNDDGTLRNSPWRRIIGDDYLEHAFRFAQMADPDAELYYNDYSLHLSAKRRGVVRLVERLKAVGCRVDGVGMQAHWALNFPSPREIDASIEAFGRVAGKVMITELDVTVLPRPNNQQGADVPSRGTSSPAMNPYPNGLPYSVARDQADRYAAFFRAFVRHRDVVDRVTLWGTDDGRSWRNHWPIRGRTAYPLLFDRQLRPKMAFDAVVQTASRPTGD